jgi:hypothetical protein
MRIILALLSAACLSGCAFMDASPETRSEFQGLAAQELGVPVNDVEVSNIHGFMLNTNWSVRTPKGRYYCSRDLNGDVTCRPD